MCKDIYLSYFWVKLAEAMDFGDVAKTLIDIIKYFMIIEFRPWVVIDRLYWFIVAAESNWMKFIIESLGYSWEANYHIYAFIHRFPDWSSKPTFTLCHKNCIDSFKIPSFDISNILVSDELNLIIFTVQTLSVLRLASDM